MYFVVRNGGRWGESDTAGLSLAIRIAQNSGALTGSDSYNNGYGYTALSTFLLAFTGQSVGALQQVIYPLLSALLVIPAWALFRELTGTRRAATLATLILFTQPEFMFVVMRGSHERMLRCFMMITLWLLARSFRLREHPRQFALHVVLFYVCAYSMVTTNAFFATSFVVAIAVAMLGAWALSGFRTRVRALTAATARRLALVGPAVLVLGFLFMFYVYPPAGKTLVFVHDLAQQTAKVTLTTDSSDAVNPYNLVVGAWISLPVYAVISVGDYLLMAAAAIICLVQGWRWLRGADVFPNIGQWLQWLFCCSFALQGALAIAGDRTGTLGGNLEYRSFPSFAMVAAPVVATALSAWRPPRVGVWAGSGLLAILAGLAILKATNEPSLSNVWMFYSPDEAEGLTWADSHLHDSAIWTGFNERLGVGFGTGIGATKGNNIFISGDARGVSALTFVVSDTIKLQSARFKGQLPPYPVQNRIFDSAGTQVYHQRPRTPYQP